MLTVRWQQLAEEEQENVGEDEDLLNPDSQDEEWCDNLSSALQIYGLSKQAKDEVIVLPQAPRNLYAWRSWEQKFGIVSWGRGLDRES